MRQAIYLAGNCDVDAAVAKGLLQADCRVYQAGSMSETLTLLEFQARERRVTDALAVLVAEIDAGGLLLLETMWQRGLRLPYTLLIDRSGRELDRARRALRVGVREYLLPSDLDAQRERRAQRFVEDAAHRRQMEAAAQQPVLRSRRSLAQRAPALTVFYDLRWDVASHTIFLGEREAMQLSPAEARTFDVLYSHLGRAVPIERLLDAASVVNQPRDLRREIQLLRTHLARLRRRLASNPNFGYRIENLRGSGYMML